MELRRRIVYDESLQPGIAAVPKTLKDELDIEDTVEIVVAGISAALLGPEVPTACLLAPAPIGV